MADVHAAQGSDAATDGGHPEEGGFGNAPLGPACLPLVDGIEQEGDEIDGKEE